MGVGKSERESAIYCLVEGALYVINKKIYYKQYIHRSNKRSLELYPLHRTSFGVLALSNLEKDFLTYPQGQ